jgi:beta-glucanase (GH16 family)
MLPDTNHYGAWASSGEIDILEAVNLGVRCEACAGGIENRILGTLHFGGTAPNNAHKGAETALPAPIDGFHTYGIVWSAGKIVWTVDGRAYASQQAGDWRTAGSSDPAAPFDRPFHLILNLAIGGGLAVGRGTRGVDESGYPKMMEVDWVRVWQCGEDAASRSRCDGVEGRVN